MKNIFNNLKDKIEQLQEDNNIYNNILSTSTTFKNLAPIPETNNEIVEYKLQQIISNSPDINKDKAIIINKLIPIEETYLTSMYVKEVLTNKEYYIIPTNKYIWILDNNNYLIFNYPNSPICNIIKNIMMGKIINLNNIILETTGSDEVINNFINIINNKIYRENIIKEKTNYLCGIIPIYQSINKLGVGLSIDKNNNIVFHNKDKNYKYMPQDITNYEILLDNSIIYSKQLSSITRVTATPMDCYTINIRITTKDNQITIPLLEPNIINSKYSKNDYIFKVNKDLAYSIIEKLKKLVP